MGFLFRKDFFGSPRFYKSPEQVAHNGVVHPSGQLAVGKSPSTAGSELYIAHWIQFPGFPELFYILYPVG